MMPVRLELTALRSPVKHSTTELLRSLNTKENFIVKETNVTHYCIQNPSVPKEKSVPENHNLSSLGKPCHAKHVILDRDRFFSMNTMAIKDSYPASVDPENSIGGS